jgi:hypothetical protein
MTLPVCAGGSLITPSEVEGARAAFVEFNAETVAEAVRAAATRAGFRKVQYQSRAGSGSYTGTRKVELTFVRASGAEATLLVRWLERAGQTYFEWAAFSQFDRSRPSLDRRSMSSFERWLVGELRSHAWRPPPQRTPINPVVLPGNAPPEKYDGQLYDYSQFATLQALTTLRTGTLPLGHYTFGWGESAIHDENLYIPQIGTRPGEELGVLLCAPQRAGKTHLLLRWTVAAARGKRTVVLIDVKGNLREKIEQALSDSGVSVPVQVFSTDPHSRSDHMNLLWGIHADQIDAQEQLMAFAEAMLPERELGPQDKGVWHRIAVGFARGALQILKLLEYYELLETNRPANLTDLYNLISRELELVNWIAVLRRHEEKLRSLGRPLARYSVEDCIVLMAIALGRLNWTVSFPDGSTRDEVFEDGERSPERTYMEYVLPLLTALDPFRPAGFMASRTTSTGDSREIRIDRVALGLQPGVVILSYRENDSGLSTAMLGLTTIRLIQMLDHRRNTPQEKTGDIVLLLDETARIRGLDAPRFVSFVRENRIGYVLVYQSLALIGPKADIQTVLRNIGTWIFLSGLAGEDLAYFNENMPGRETVRRLEGDQTSPDGRTRSSTQQGREVPFLNAAAAERFPGGSYPAMIRVSGWRPFFTDLANM